MQERGSEQNRKKENGEKRRRTKREKELYRLSKKTIVVPALGLQYT